MEVNTTILVISILVAFSGWAKFLYDIFTSAPKIRGQIFNYIIGQMDNPENPSETLTSFVVCLYLTNKRKNGVHILDCELELDSGNGFEKLLRVYGAQNIENWWFSSETHSINIPDFNRKLIYRSNRPIEYGVPIHGFAMFASKKLYHSFFESGGIRKCRVTVIDAFQNRHKITSSAHKFPDFSLFKDLFGIELTPLEK